MGATVSGPGRRVAPLGDAERTCTALVLAVLVVLSAVVTKTAPQAARPAVTVVTVPLAAAAAHAPPVPPQRGAALPKGKGMWLNHFERAEGGDVRRIVDRAVANGLTHLYVRLGSSKKGFYAQEVLERLLPAAHAAGLLVVGWDFPYLADPAADAARAHAEITYTTSTGDRIDAFSADIETPAEGTHLSPGAARLYGTLLRQVAGENYPLIATVPRPSPKRSFPYADVVAGYDAIAPMVYWGTRDAVADVTGAIADLAAFGKPILPIGQAYDSAIDGWAGGVPTRATLERFIAASAARGATGVSFWVWDTATPGHWAAIAGAPQFPPPPADSNQR